MKFTEDELKAACEMAANRTAELVREKMAALADGLAGLAGGDGAVALRAFAAVLRDDLGLNKPDGAA